MDADELYGLPLDRFVAERGALAKSLRKEGRRDEAGEVAALRKPSVAAWAVNQLVRTQRAAMQDLLDAGDELRDAQSDLLSGSGDGRTLRAAGERERSAVDALVQTARGLLSSEGVELSPTILERVSDTLHAAALDEDARERVRSGRLERELRHVGLGLGLGAGDPFAAAPPARTRAPAKERRGGAAGPARGRTRPDETSDNEAAAAPADPAKPSAAGKRSGSADASSADRPAKSSAAGKRSGSGDARSADRPAKSSAAGKPSGSADSRSADRPAKRSATDKRAERERAEAERAEAGRVRRELLAARRDARAAHATARRRADASTAALHTAEERRDDAAEALREAEARVASAAEQSETAHATLQRAQAALAEAENRL